MPLFATIDHLLYKNSLEKLLTLTMGDKHCLNFNSKIILYTLLAMTDPHSVPPENHVILTKIILPVPPPLSWWNEKLPAKKYNERT